MIFREFTARRDERGTINHGPSATKEGTAACQFLAGPSHAYRCVQNQVTIPLRIRLSIGTCFCTYQEQLVSYGDLGNPWNTTRITPI